jgi:hypothetical protein
VHKELVWQYSSESGGFEQSMEDVVTHITHNGDFDVLNAFSHKIVVDDVGLFLERVLHCPNNLKGDSPKVAGCMDLFRVQGRWAASARLAYVRLLGSAQQVSGGEALSKGAPNSFPNAAYWDLWAGYFEGIFMEHKNNLITHGKRFDEMFGTSEFYSLKTDAVDQFVQCVEKGVDASGLANLPQAPADMKLWTDAQVHSFCANTVDGFLRHDLYNAMVEFLSRAEGSFGLQAHCTLETGSVVIASKGQPMSLAFDQELPLVLYGSEAEAVSVPVDTEGRWLPQRIDLDSKGEVMRVGLARTLLEPTQVRSPMAFKSGIEIRSFVLSTMSEETSETLNDRSISVLSAALPYDPKRDLVESDLRVTPAVLAEIDKGTSAWYQ